MSPPDKPEAAQVLSGLRDVTKTLEILVEECGPNLALLDVCRERVEGSRLPGAGAERTVRALEVVSRALQFLEEIETACRELFQMEQGSSDTESSQSEPGVASNGPGSKVPS